MLESISQSRPNMAILGIFCIFNFDQKRERNLRQYPNPFLWRNNQLNKAWARSPLDNFWVTKKGLDLTKSNCRFDKKNGADMILSPYRWCQIAGGNIHQKLLWKFHQDLMLKMMHNSHDWRVYLLLAIKHMSAISLKVD